MDGLAGFSWGLFGGLLGELLLWFQLRHRLHEGLPDWSKSIAYWIVTGLMVLCGGGLVMAYLGSGAGLNPILAINIGIPAPLLLKNLAAQLLPIEPGRAD